MTDQKIDFETYFKQYEAIVEMAEGIFQRVKSENEAHVNCKVGCSDCCFALFDLTLIEAMYLNYHARKQFKGKMREEMIEGANRADRMIYKVKRNAYKSFEKGENEVKILAEIGAERVRCPLLNKADQCDLYENRPITCRLYGIPTAIGGMSHTCGLSGFSEGTSYPTVNMDVIYKQLHTLSEAFVASINTRHIKMADMLVPVSMAMLTNYDEEFFGLKNGAANIRHEQGGADD